jgi:pSer/pThr/pTyr-binding forkhead associated (FHA) protein/tetratricopeptide (TPR) repeat protein
MFKLVIQDDEGKTTIVPLIRDEITIGRKEGNTIRLTERNVSRRHARILRNNGEVQIEDLGSYNGIRVNNARIAERVSLRVSDQVQIGDYKLYLKAEGVEQVDEARTMPIERLEAVAPTDQLPAVAPVPTAQMAAAASPSMVGNPNRTLVAIADTDPQGRPVATAAAVAALTTPVGYGKLVVLSSNFAGKEFELSRPQMIIGRTDENDIVINHRSISRNHAKLVREPESGRYTISDLQSSNGVRVNGQDYGKVELRRGDVVDLGHVRLRFIEPGEDFVFTRDAVITDVPDVGSKRGLLVAVVLGIVVLGGVAVFLLTHNNTDPPKKEEVVEPKNNTIDGSNMPDASTQIAVTNPTVADAASATTNPPPTSDLIAECTTLKANKKWSDLHTCGERLQATDPAKGKEFMDVAASEMTAERINAKIGEAIASDNLHEAKRLLDSIPNSVYHQAAEDKYNERDKKDIEDETRNANKMLAKHDCTNLALASRQAASRSEGVAEAVRAIAAKCVTVPTIDPATEALKKEIAEATAKANQLSQNNDCAGLKNLAATSHKEVAEAIKEIVKSCKAAVVQCDPTDFHDRGIASVNLGQYAAALSLFEQALNCKSSQDTVRLAYLAACHSKNAAKARLYFSRLPTIQQRDLQAMCLRDGIQVP